MKKLIEELHKHLYKKTNLLEVIMMTATLNLLNNSE